MLTSIISSDWMFAGLCFLFLLLLGELKTQRSWWLAALVGIVLGLASLTRMTGVLLGAALIAQWITVVREQRSRPFRSGLLHGMPEVFASLIGLLLWTGWMVALTRARAVGDAATGNYELYGMSLFQHFQPLVLTEAFLDLLLQFRNLMPFLGPAGPVVLSLSLIHI